jgi:hypothetical protein
MDALLSFLVVIGCLLAVMGFFTWLASRIRRRGTAMEAAQVITGAYDTMYRPTAHDSHYEIQAQSERKTPFSSPDEPWRPTTARAVRPSRDARRPRRRHPWWAPRRRAR